MGIHFTKHKYRASREIMLDGRLRKTGYVINFCVLNSFDNLKR